jgi:hypothetical protein
VCTDLLSVTRTVASVPEAPPDYASDFAEVLARRRDRQMMLDHDNDASWSKWDPACGRPFAVSLVDEQEFCGCLALDIDVKAGRVGPLEAEATLRWLVATLRDAGIAHVVASSGGGGAHIFATLRRPVPFEHISQIVNGLRNALGPAGIAACLDPARRFIRPPGSPHRSLDAWSTVDDPREALATLRRGNPNTRLRNLASNIGVRLLGVEATLLLAGRTTGREYPSDSEPFWTVLVAFANQSTPLEEVVTAVTEAPGAVGRRAQKVGHADISRFYDEATAWVAANPAVACPRDALKVIDAIQIAAERDLRTTRRRSLYPVMLGLTAMARQGGLEFNASMRDIALCAGVSVGTASSAVRDLIRQGWIRKVASPRRRSGLAHGYRLLRKGPNLNTYTGTKCRGGASGSVQLSSAAADVWRWRGGLGKSAWALYTLLVDGDALAIGDAATALNFSPHWTRVLMERLAVHGLAVRLAGGKYGVGPVSPWQVAVAASGTAARQRRRIEAERAVRPKTLRRLVRERSSLSDS